MFLPALREENVRESLRVLEAKEYCFSNFKRYYFQPKSKPENKKPGHLSSPAFCRL
jgi:hypothetical protein